MSNKTAKVSVEQKGASILITLTDGNDIYIATIQDFKQCQSTPLKTAAECRQFIIENIYDFTYLRSPPNIIATMDLGEQVISFPFIYRMPAAMESIIASLTARIEQLELHLNLKK